MDMISIYNGHKMLENNWPEARNWFSEFKEYDVYPLIQHTGLKLTY